MSDATILIVAVVTLVTAGTAFISVIINAHRLKRVDTKIEEVHAEVKTANSLSMAELLDAQETRRIDEIPVSEQTAGEKTHVAKVPPKEG